MQKKIIALAVAALASSAAFAQSNVTIYGVADAAVLSVKTDDAKRATQVNSGGLAASRIGFKGVEDLGNGLKALFVLEYRLDIDQNEGVGSWTSGAGQANAASAGPARQQMVGLTGGFGTAVAGRLQTTAYDWAVSYDILAGTAISPLQNVNGTNFVIGGTTAGARANNAVAYISPSFGGLTVAYNRAYFQEQGFGSNTPANAPNWAATFNNTAIANMLSANYKNGPIAAGVVYSVLDNKTIATAASADYSKTTDWALGGSYDLGVAKLTGTYQTSKAKNSIAGVSTSFNKDKAWSLGVAVPVTSAGTVIASYAKNGIKSTDTPVATFADNTSSYTLAYTHAMSKRTKLYAGYTAINRGNDVLVTVNGATNNTLATGAGGRDTSILVGGINHSF